MPPLVQNLSIRTKMAAAGLIAAACLAAMAAVGWRIHDEIGEAVAAAGRSVAAMESLGDARAEVRLIPSRTRDLGTATNPAALEDARGAIRDHIARSTTLLEEVAAIANDEDDARTTLAARLALKRVGAVADEFADTQSEILSLRDERLLPAIESLQQRIVRDLESLRRADAPPDETLRALLDRAAVEAGAVRIHMMRFLASRDIAWLVEARQSSLEAIARIGLARLQVEDAGTKASLAETADAARSVLSLVERLAILIERVVEFAANDLRRARLESEAAIAETHRRHSTFHVSALARLSSAAADSLAELVLFGLASLIGVLGAGIAAYRMATRPVLTIAQAMLRIRDGRHDTSVPYAARPDEIGDLARAAVAFRESLVEVTASREQLEQMLQRQRETEAELRRLALVVERTERAVVITDRESRIEWVNKAYVALTGYTPEEVIGQRPGRFLQGPETSRKTVAEIREAIAAGRGFQAELINYRRDGTPYWVEIRATPIHDAEGRVSQYISIQDDCTQRRLDRQRLEDALETEREAHEQRKRFVTIASHEFRTPLAIIDSTAQRLLHAEIALPPDKLAERAGRIRNAVARMIQMIDRTLYAARLENGRIRIDRAPLDLAPLLRSAVGRQLEIATNFTITLPDRLPPMPIDGDAQLLEQVFQNLLSNAVKYSGNSTHISIDAGTEAGEALVAITDHGVGIPADELPAMFRRFFRASTAQGIAGTGIGLNFVKEIVAMHGGRIDVASTVGRGSTFTLRMPLAPAARGEIRPAAA